MKVVSGKPALAGAGAAEACPVSRGRSMSGFIGTLKRSAGSLYRHRVNLTLIGLALLCFALPHLVRAEDMLASQKQDAQDTFGHGSTLEWGFYIGEVLLSIYLYIKSRNPMVFVGGLVFLVVVTRTLFAIAG
ncbi:MAG: conjugal transfer protein TraA [Pantoea sp.]|uniref:conjugal transfer protein TraA n=1 Tax=unclassified Pantoea TaxID=2630326 RepID=UPI0023A72AF9|nr:conjugal transfer protein TraA [Pantoea sp.]MDE1188843.1 conjugal transfer protein TraA [Pantoea sp.]